MGFRESILSLSKGVSHISNSWGVKLLISQSPIFGGSILLSPLITFRTKDFFSPHSTFLINLSVSLPSWAFAGGLDYWVKRLLCCWWPWWTLAWPDLQGALRRLTQPRSPCALNRSDRDLKYKTSLKLHYPFMFTRSSNVSHVEATNFIYSLFVLMSYFYL